MQTSSQITKNHNVEELVTQLKAIDGGFYYYVFTIIAYKSVVSSCIMQLVIIHLYKFLRIYSGNLYR